jgi:hypothetical protein
MFGLLCHDVVVVKVRAEMGAVMAREDSPAESDPHENLQLATTQGRGDEKRRGGEGHCAVKYFGALIRSSLLMATVTGGTAGTAWAQASETEMRSFPMPPVQGYKVEKTFMHPGDYGYYLSDYQAAPSQNSTPNLDYDFFRYAGVRGKNVYIYGAWGTIPIPPPTVDAAGRITADACAHSHLSYGVWARYMLELNVGFVRIPIGPLWFFLGGGGMSGVRATPSSPCVLAVNNSLAPLDSRFGWGASLLNWDSRGHIPLPPGFGPPYWRAVDILELVLGVQANTHGWGSCGTFACHMPAYSIAYTLP